MAVGLDANKAEIDSAAATCALQMRETFAAVARLQTYLAATADATLVGLGYTSGEVATLKSAIADLNQLRTIYEGTANLASAKDFRTFAKQLTGVR